MKYSEARQGRIFVIRLEDGDVLHDELERFAVEKKVNAAYLIAVGGADSGSRLVVGPEEGRATPVKPMEHILSNVHEIAGVGTIFPDDQGAPILHMHIACGRQGQTITGCVRNGVKVWHVQEVIMIELLDTKAIRSLDMETGFKLLRP